MESLRLEIRNTLGREIYNDSFDVVLRVIGLTETEVAEFVASDVIDESKYQELEKFYIEQIR